MRSTARTVQPLLEEYSEGELRNAHAHLVLARQIGLPFEVARRHPCFSHVLRCKARSLRHMAAAQKPSGYVRAEATDIRRTIARAAADLDRLSQRPLALEDVTR